MWRAYLSGSTNALGCFNLIVSAYMNTTILRTRIVVIALMAGFAWGQGHMKSGPAEGGMGKAVEAGQGSVDRSKRTASDS
jgi:hypothetical protein